MQSDWKKVYEYLSLAGSFIDPHDSVETAFFFLKLSELITNSKVKSEGNA